MAADTPIRWYLQRAAASIKLVVERVDDCRGYRMFVNSRAEARRELPHLRRLVLSIGEPAPPVRIYDPVTIDEVFTPVNYDEQPRG